MLRPHGTTHRYALLAIVVAIVAVWGCETRHESVAPLTEEQLQSLEPRAREAIVSAEAAAADGSDAAAAGHLAMLLHAHGFLDAAAEPYARARSQAPTDERWYRLDAHRAAEAGDEALALALATEAVAIDGRSVRARTTLAETQLRRGDLEEAREHLRAALELAPEDPAALAAMGDLETKAGNLSEALGWLERAIAAEPGAAHVHYAIAMVLARMGREEEATEHMTASRAGPARRPAIEPPDEIVALQSRGSRPALAAGTALLASGDVDAAVRALTEAVESDPDSADAHNTLGAALETAGERERALSHYERAVAIDPSLAAARKNLGVLLGRLGRLDRAVHHLEESLRLGPGSAEARAALAAALESRGQRAEAIAAYRDALSLDPANARLHRRLGILLGESGDLTEARAHLERALSIEPESAEAHHFLAIALHQSNERSQAIEHEERAIELGTGSGDLLATAHYGLAMMLQEEGRLADSLPHLERARTLFPDNLDVARELARTYHSAGRHDEAIDLQTRVAERRPQDADVHYRLGVFLAAKGELERARESFQESLRIDPSFRPSLDAMEKLNDASATR